METKPTYPPVFTATYSCPEDMALVWRITTPYCIDRYEGSLVHAKDANKVWPHNKHIDGREKSVLAVSVAGRRPQGYISGQQAAQVCKQAGKRLCEIDEWVTACRGPNRTVYPYGNKRRPNKCNDRFKTLNYHPVPRLWKKHASADADPKLMWHPSWMNDDRLVLMDHTLTNTGEKSECTNGYGVYDMVGNLHEWVNDPAGTFFGGFFMDTFQNGQGCEYRTRGHGFEYHDYSTGFRCCDDATATSTESATETAASAEPGATPK